MCVQIIPTWAHMNLEGEPKIDQVVICTCSALTPLDFEPNTGPAWNPTSAQITQNSASGQVQLLAAY